MEPQIRKICTYHEEILFDMRPLEQPFRHVVVAAVIKNPWFDRGLVEDLKPEIAALAPVLGKILANKAAELMGGPDAIEAFGKAGSVGLGGEYEHANALIHTTLFGDECRRAINGTSWMVGNQKIAPAGAAIELPMSHKHEPKWQNYYHTISLTIPDAPRVDELVIAVGMASGTRPNGRL